jgi:predicted N-acyltransferase
MNIFTEVSKEQWDKFLTTNPSATIYHTPQWKEFLEKTLGYKPYYYFVIDDNGIITGIMPLFLIKSRFFGNRFTSAPFSHICGPIGDLNSINQLLKNCLEIYQKSNAKYLQINDFVDDNRFKHSISFSTYILELSENPKDTWKKLDKSSVRWAITKSEKLGVKVSESKSLEDLHDFYNINCLTKKELGVPAHPWYFFENMLKYLNEMMHVYIVKKDDLTIGGGIFLAFKNEMIYGYGAAHPKYLKLYPYNACIWRSVQDACQQGFNKFDFGRTSNTDEGLTNFKKRWGTQEVKMTYSYYPRDPKSIIANRNNIVYKTITGIIKKTPLEIYKVVSNQSFKELG